MMTWEEGSANAEADTDAQAASEQEPERTADDESGTVGARIDSVLAAAERAATGIREEAREWARQHKEESQQRAEELAAGHLRELWRLTDDLRASAHAVAQECDQVIKAIEDSSGRATSDESSPRPGVAGSESETADDLQDTARAGASASPGKDAISDRARLYAAQMIAAGDSREQISRRLRKEFGIQDAGAMLDRMGA